MKEAYKFWYIVGTSIMVFIYIFLITFLHVDKEQQRFADTALGLLLGTILTGGLNYLLGGSAQPHNQNPKNPNKMNPEVFWDIQDLNDTLLEINGVSVGTPYAVKDIVNQDSNYKLVLDDTNVLVLTVENLTSVSFKLNNGTENYTAISVVSSFAGGRPKRPN